MPLITAIKKQKRGSRANVYIDGEFSFGIDLENLIKFGLKVENELSEEDIKKIVEQAEYQKTFERLVIYATARPRSKKEVTDWFWRKKTSQVIQSRLVKKLEKLGLLDDYEFAKWWVEQRLTFRPKGRRALKQELRQKGISREIISEVLEKAEIDELPMAKELIEKNKYKWERFDEDKRKKKMIDFLARKGFGWEIIKEAL